MAEKKAVVAISSKGNIAGAYESISEAARINGFDTSGISHALSKDYTYKKFKWMLESEYRKLWFEGRTDELCYTLHQRASDKVRRRWRNATEEERNSWRKSMSESAKRRMQELPGAMEQVRKAHCKPILCVNTDEVFDSVTAFSKVYGALPNVVSTAARKGYKVWGKLTVKYITKEEYEEHCNKTRNQGQDNGNPA